MRDTLENLEEKTSPEHFFLKSRSTDGLSVRGNTNKIKPQTTKPSEVDAISAQNILKFIVML